MKITRKLLFVILADLILQNAYAVGDSLTLAKRNLIFIGVTGSKFAVRDESTSPLIYKGLLGGFHAGSSFSGKKSFTDIDYSFTYGDLVTRNYSTDNNKASAYNNFFAVESGRGLSLNSNFQFYFGGQLAVLANFRNNTKFYNSNFNYEGFASLGPMVLVKKFFSVSEQRRISLSATVAFPLINLTIRPPYNTIEDFVDQNTGFSPDRIKFASLGKLISVNTRISLNYYLSNRNSLMLTYTWYTYRYYPGENNLRNVSGHLSLSFVFKVNK